FPNKQISYPGSDPQAQYLPGLHGDYYMHLGLSPKPNIFNPEPTLTIYKRGLPLPILKRPDIEIPATDAANMKHDFTFDKRVLLIPQAKLLITIPLSNDRLILYRIDLESALPRIGYPERRGKIPANPILYLTFDEDTVQVKEKKLFVADL